MHGLVVVDSITISNLSLCFFFLLFLSPTNQKKKNVNEELRTDAGEWWRCGRWEFRQNSLRSLIDLIDDLPQYVTSSYLGHYFLLDSNFALTVGKTWFARSCNQQFDKYVFETRSNLGDWFTKLFIVIQFACV